MLHDWRGTVKLPDLEGWSREIWDIGEERRERMIEGEQNMETNREDCKCREKRQRVREIEGKNDLTGYET